MGQSNPYDALGIDGNMILPNARKGVYDYYIRDYQQNVRMILTEEIHTGNNTCTMEPDRAGNEEPVFGQAGPGNEVAQRSTTPPGWQSNASGYVSKLSALANKVGPNVLLKVMAGDEITATTKYYYQNAVTNGTGNSLSSNIITSLIQSILGSSSTSSLAKGNTANISTDLSADPGFLNATNPGASDAGGSNPKAYLSVIFFDERFNFVNEGSTAIRVATAGDGAPLLPLPAIKSPKNGYAYVYVSNESNEPVYFDDLHVADNRGRLIEEDHYYAYGLKITGISSKKLPDPNEGNIDNKNLYNDKELFDDGDLNWYDYGFRNYDPQIGRFTQLDPLTDSYPELTNYQYASCDPISNIDIDGLEGGLATVGASTGVVTSQSFMKEIIIKAVKHSSQAASNTTTTVLKIAIKSVSLKIDHTAVTTSNYNPDVPGAPHNSIGRGSHQTAGMYIHGGSGTSDNYSDNADYYYEPLDLSRLLPAFRSVGLNRNAAWEYWHKPNFLHTVEVLNGAANAGEVLDAEKEKLTSNSANSGTSYNPTTSKPRVNKYVNLGRAKQYNYYYHKNNSSGYTSGKADSLIPGKGGAADTNLIRTFSRPKTPKNDIPRK